jgi:hypothetical protein
LPAAIMATATRGPVIAEREVARLREEADEKEELPFDFFIGPNIPCLPTRWLFPRSIPKSCRKVRRR